VAGPTTVEEYLAGFPDDVRALLENARAAIRRVLPDAEERISYGIIRFGISGRHAIYLAGWKKHLGVYPVPAAEGEFERELAPYRAAKDSLHFPYAKPIPYDLIERVTAFVVEP
jgi:uncharacterized protein YdhG (YjbR/CyaY superfamily)